MKIDCCNLACPEPVLKTKKALEELPDDSILEVKVNSISSKENVTRFATKAGYESRMEESDDGTAVISIIKGYACAVVASDGDDRFYNKTLFLKTDKVGSGELGEKLMAGFLKSILELPKLPNQIICVNEAVKLTTAPADHDVIQSLQALESKGVEIYSCGVCLEYFNVVDDLKVGKIGNAYATVEMLLESENTISL
ncbi:sulfurtransferase-like selenium metabolism protein YedF [Sulfurospirillum sp. 1612]|uniref:sulfurtransferase-like selenium metabolism protein YedF n=1 Tax=Sulfurospirillum sp. 1612 TaxID=3094835 RepID=UPI002F92D7BD